jgi:hypothetical protein
MRFYQETTDWGDQCPNHIYILDKGLRTMYAYIQAETNQHKVFSKPITIDPRGRTFKDLGPVKGFKISG